MIVEDEIERCDNGERKGNGGVRIGSLRVAKISIAVFYGNYIALFAREGYGNVTAGVSRDAEFDCIGVEDLKIGYFSIAEGNRGDLRSGGRWENDRMWRQGV